MRKKHNLAFHLVMLLLIVVVTILVFYKALVHLRSQIDEIKINSVYRIRQIIEDYDLLLASNEEMIGNKLEQKFSEIREIFASRDLSSLSLDKIAQQHGLDFILLCDMEGKVKVSTEMKLKGEDLSELMPFYSDVISKIKDEDELVLDRAGLLPQDSIIYKSGWYADIENDRVLIMAINMRKYFEENNSDSFADYLFGGYFDNLARSVQLVSQINFGFVQNGQVNFYSGIISNYDSSENIQTSTSIEGQILNNYEKVILPVVLSNSLGSCLVQAEVSFDNDMIRLISMNLLFRALLGFIILALVIYLIVYFFFKAIQKDREEAMLSTLKDLRGKKFSSGKIEEGTFRQEIEYELKGLAEEFQTENMEVSQELKLQKAVDEARQEKLAKENTQLKILLKEAEENKRETDQIRRTDRITGLPNHETLMEYLDYESGRTNREKTEFSIVIIKINNLEKLIKDHDDRFADYILNKIGAKLRSSLRKQDRIGRWDKDEFMLVLPITGSDGTKKLIMKLQDMIKSTEFYKEDKRENIELIFGASVYKPGNKVEDCLRRTGVAVQEAEHTGQRIVME